MLRRPVAIDALYRWPHTTAFVAGFVYWAWLWPSWIGITIMGASLLLALRSGWPGRSLRLEESTVIRAARSNPSAP